MPPETLCRLLIAAAVAVGLAVAAPSRAAEPPGSLLAFGLNSQGQLGSTENLFSYTPNPAPRSVALPDGAGTAVDVAVGAAHTLVLTSNGRVYSFGRNRFGQLGRSENSGTGTPDPAPGLVTLPGATGTPIAVAAGAVHSLVLTDDGELYSFGRNNRGQLGNGTFDFFGPHAVPAPVVLPGQTGQIALIAAGQDHSLAATSTGQLYSFGHNKHYELGRGSSFESDPVPAPAVLPGQDGTVTQLVAGRFHALVLTSGGQLFGFGRARWGELGALAYANMGAYFGSAPALVTLPTGAGEVTSVLATGSFHSLVATSTGKFYGFGYNAWGQLGRGAVTYTPTPAPAEVTLPGLQGRVVGLGGGSSDSFAISSSGQLYSFGYNRFGQLGRAATGFNPNPTPEIVPQSPGTTIGTVGRGPTANHTMAIVSGLTVDAGTLPNARSGATYDAPLSAAGGTAPLQWSASGLPAGLSLDSGTGRIGGTPTATGSFPLDVTVRDRHGIEASRTVTLVVDEPPAPQGTTQQQAQTPVATVVVPAPTGEPAKPERIVARVLIRHGAFRAVKRRFKLIELVCPASASDGCAGTVAIRSRFGDTAPASYRLTTGEARTYLLPLPRKLLRRLERRRKVGRAPLRVVVTSTAPGSAAGTERTLHVWRGPRAKG